MNDIAVSDPYCIIYIGRKRVAKTSIRTWTVNPKWNETFSIPLLHLKHPLLIEVWDHDSARSDNLLAKAEVILNDIPSNISTEYKLDLQKASKKVAPRGILHLELHLEVISRI